MFASTDEEREQARHIVANEARYATAFALLAMATSDKPVAFQTALPESHAAPASRTRRSLTISSPNLLVGLGSALFFFVTCFMSYYWYLGFQITADREAYQQERRQQEIYKEYAAKRAEKEAEARHIADLVTIVEAEQTKQPLPL
jgi:hypothetical protein